MAEVNPTSPPHLTPPLTEEELTDWLRLLRSPRVGIATFYRLMGQFGSAAAALNALLGIARDAGVADYTPCPPGVAADELSRADLAGAEAIAFGAPDYPALLAEIADPPPLLWARGDISLLGRPGVAIVGARNASGLGTRMARRLAREIGAEGPAIVSGMARGIDTAAHLESLATGTIAVFAGGVDVIYPAENTVLAQEISEVGLCLSEQPMGLRPTARHFPRRNRLIAGLAQGTVVVEAAAKSGSLITARIALDQGREVFAVPGHPFDARATGCNILIRDGATLVRSGRDVLESLTVRRPAPVQDTAARPAPDRSLAEIARIHSQILSRLSVSPIAEDQLIRDIAAPASALAPELVTLELEGKIRREAGGLIALAS